MKRPRDPLTAHAVETATCIVLAAMKRAGFVDVSEANLRFGEELLKVLKEYQETGVVKG